MDQPVATPLPGSIGREKARRRRLNLLPFWLIAPTILVLLAIQVYPMIYTVVLSFQERNIDRWDFVGLQNFDILFGSAQLAESAGHTIVYLVGFAGLTLTLGFIIALLLNRKSRFSGLYVTMLFIPWILADIIAGVVFRLLVLPDYGLFSGILQNPALFPPNGLSVLTADAPAPWIGSFPFPPSPAMVYVILAATWRCVPFTTLLLLASLQTISNEIVESARIDGANRWQLVRHITIPLILPTMVVALFNLTLGGINSLGLFFSLTSGGPGTSTTVLSYLLYSIGWVSLDFGRAAALAMLLGIVNLSLIAGTLRITRAHQRSQMQ